MSGCVEFRSSITRSRGNSRFIEIELLGKEYQLRRGDPRDLAVLANLMRDPRFEGRAKIAAYELITMPTHGELWLDIEGDADIAWIAPEGVDPIEAGPHALNAASLAFFGRPFRTRAGRSPRAMAECRGGACEDCGAPAEHAHHLEPRAMGGEDVAENLVPLCAECHKRRHQENGAIALRPGRYRVEVLRVSYEPSVLSAACGFPRIVWIEIQPTRRMYSVEWPVNLVHPTAGMWDLHLGREGRRLAVRYAEGVAA